MTARALFAALVLSLAVLPATTAEAPRFATAYYLGSGDLATATVLGTNVGGASFMPDPTERAVVITVNDANAGHAVTLTACQDLNSDGLCGDAARGEAGATGCGSVALTAQDELAFSPAHEVVVFVHAAGFAVRGGCGFGSAPSGGYLTAVFT